MGLLGPQPRTITEIPDGPGVSGHKASGKGLVGVAVKGYDAQDEASIEQAWQGWQAQLRRRFGRERGTDNAQGIVAEDQQAQKRQQGAHGGKVGVIYGTHPGRCREIGYFRPMRKCMLLASFALLALTAQAQPGFMKMKITAAGKPISYRDLVAKCAEADIIFFGELHDDSLCHEFEKDLLISVLTEMPPPPMLAMEMLEADHQTVLDEYLAGQITEKQWEVSANLWDNWADYKPLLSICKVNHVPLIATNVPRRYASLVARRGLKALDSLSGQAKAWMAPMPLQVPYGQASYRMMRDMMGGHGGEADTAATNRFVAAQAIKDATMAYFIAKNRPPGTRLLHINGSFHSDYNEGILTYLKKLDPKARTLTISFRQKGAEDAGKKGLADVVVTKN